MQSIINKISKEYIHEAKSSPRMLEDLAAMEKYMAESYDGRTFVELLQNADDAGAKRIFAITIGDSLIVGNDGRPFSESDIQSICRSGSSNKRRGAGIGYRGVGFKSATSLSTEIIIHSSNAFFTFSKNVCANILSTDQEKVPTVRIPFLYNSNNLDEEILLFIQNYQKKGYSTFFIFNNVNIDKFLLEVQTYDDSWLLFLNSLNSVEINCLNLKFKSKSKIQQIDDGQSIISFCDKNEHWYKVSLDDASLAFKYDKIKGVVPCNDDEGVYHCFLPTLDKTGFPLKINADFSTDPSRKHIILDGKSMQSIINVQDLYVKTIENKSRLMDYRFYQIIGLLSSMTTLNPLVLSFKNELFKKLKKSSWVLTNNNTFIYPSNVNLFPKWLDQNERMKLSEYCTFLDNKVIKDEWIENIDKIDNLLMNLGASEIDIRILAKAITDINVIKHLEYETVAKLFVYSHRILLKEKNIIDCFYVVTENGYIKIADVDENISLNLVFVSLLKDIISSKELENLSNNYPIFGKKISKMKNNSKPNHKPVMLFEKASVSNELLIDKSKSPLQNCILLENNNGNQAFSVQGKTREYSVLSRGKNAEEFYICIKSIKTLDDPFYLTELEYNSAMRYANKYKIYLFATENDDVKYKVINYPKKQLDMNKVAKEWHWKCLINNSDVLTKRDEYFDVNDESEIDLESSFDDMNGIEFERFCAEVLEKNGYENVSITSATSDQGIDIIAYRDCVKYGIQCKCYSSDVGNDAVQEAYSGKTFYKCHIGVVLSNRCYTKSAIELAESNGIVLWDRNNLLRLIKKTI